MVTVTYVCVTLCTIACIYSAVMVSPARIRPPALRSGDLVALVATSAWVTTPCAAISLWPAVVRGGLATVHGPAAPYAVQDAAGSTADGVRRALMTSDPVLGGLPYGHGDLDAGAGTLTIQPVGR
ncbi:hypothetical protein [Actinoplanes sp. NPDC051494]|uniref:hypothetical protein n=1 Tax=Actinoplanes sp. NPDC051494 TaxID=3363907 RepID=UPI00379A6C9B